MEKQCLVIDVGGTFMKYGLIDQSLEITERGEIPTSYSGPEEYIKVLAGICRQFEGRICGVALSVPGVIDHERGIQLNGGNMKGVWDFPLADELEKQCHLPVTAVNDAKAAAAAEIKWGALEGVRSGVVLVLGTGVGGALVLDGKVLTGHHFSAGEFGYMIRREDYEEDLDMEYNSWASIGGNRRLRQMAAEVKGLRMEDVMGTDIFRWAEEGDEEILKVLDKFTLSLAHLVLNVQAVFDPEVFAVGGGISRQPLLYELMNKNISKLYQRLQYPFPLPKLVSCRFYNDANLIGAYSNFCLQFR